MIKIYIKTILILIFILSPSLNAAAQKRPNDPIHAELIRVIDGSQIEVRVTRDNNQPKLLTINLMGIDAPKLDGACPQERALAQKAKNRLEQILNKQLILSELSELENSQFFMAQVMTPDGTDPVHQLTSEKLTRPYWGGHTFGWCKDQTTCLTEAGKDYDEVR